MAKLKFNQLELALKEFRRKSRKLPLILGNKARNHFRKSFLDEGFTDGSLQKWQEVDRRKKGTRAYKYPKKKDLSRRRRGILRKSGALMRSINVLKHNFNSIVVGSKGIPYAEVHNDGGRAGRRGKQFKMPKRQFIGNSSNLEKEMEKRIMNEIDKIFK